MLFKNLLKITFVLYVYRNTQISLSEQIDCKNTVFLQDKRINVLFEISFKNRVILSAVALLK